MSLIDLKLDDWIVAHNVGDPRGLSLAQDFVVRRIDETAGASVGAILNEARRRNVGAPTVLLALGQLIEAGKLRRL